MSAAPEPEPYITHRSESEWVARWNERPDLYEDLLDVLSGHRTPGQIGRERHARRALDAQRTPEEG